MGSPGTAFPATLCGTTTKHQIKYKKTLVSAGAARAVRFRLTMHLAVQCCSVFLQISGAFRELVVATARSFVELRSSLAVFCWSCSLTLLLLLPAAVSWPCPLSLLCLGTSSEWFLQAPLGRVYTIVSGSSSNTYSPTTTGSGSCCLTH